MLFYLNPNFYVDEAQYWIWSQNFDFGYYSKPPMVAWFISFFELLFGDSSISTKSISLFTYPFSAFFVFLIGRELADEKTAFYSSILFFTMPAVSLSSLIISTDVVLLLFWSGALFWFIKAIKTDKIYFWILAGVFGGFGLLSKYNMIIFVVAVFIFLIYSNQFRKHLKNKNLYLTLLIAILVFSPNLIWNYQNNFVSFVHLQEISQVEKELFHLDKMFEFLGAQFGIFGIVSFALLLFLVFKIRANFKDETFVMLFVFTFLFLGVITTQAFLSRAFANWAAPSYVGASLLVGYYFIKSDKSKILKIAIALNLFLMALIYHFDDLTQIAGIEQTRKNDPFRRIRGWDQAGVQIAQILQNNRDRILLAGDRDVLSEMIYYARPYAKNGEIFNPTKKVQNYFEQIGDMNKFVGKNFVFVSKTQNIENVSKYFTSANFLQKIEIKIHKDYSLEFYIYTLDEFKGY
jgi:4-amino-4-deoxy-L-arabinose transferase-like glycosyltransferase